MNFDAFLGQDADVCDVRLMAVHERETLGRRNVRLHAANPEEYRHDRKQNRRKLGWCPLQEEETVSDQTKEKSYGWKEMMYLIVVKTWSGR